MEPIHLHAGHLSKGSVYKHHAKSDRDKSPEEQSSTSVGQDE